MANKKRKPNRSGRRGLAVSLYPMSPDEALRAVLSISKEDVKRIIGKGKRKGKHSS